MVEEQVRYFPIYVTGSASCSYGCGAFGVAIYIESFLGLVRQKNNNLSLVVMPRGLYDTEFVNYGAMDA